MAGRDGDREWRVAEIRFLSAIEDAEVKAVLRRAVEERAAELQGKRDRGDLKQIALWSLFNTCRRLTLSETTVDAFFAYLRKAVVRDLRDDNRLYHRQKRNVLLETMALDELERSDHDLTLVVTQVSVEQMVIDNDFTRKLEIVVRRVANDTTQSVFSTIMSGTPWNGSRATFKRHRDKIIGIGRALIAHDQSASRQTASRHSLS